jgi:hypothetical protein
MGAVLARSTASSILRELRYRFKRSGDPDEFEQFFTLNHAVFAGELEQHPTQPGERLVDKFHDRTVRNRWRARSLRHDLC